MQTAIEWFDQKLQEFAGFQSWSPDKSVVIKLIIPVSEYDNLKEQAKKMEQGEICLAFLEGQHHSEKLPSQYYIDTYGSKGSDEDLIDAINMARNEPDMSGDDIILSIKQSKSTSSQTEISDEEIEKAWSIVETTHVDKWVSFKSMFIEGAKWYREQLKSRQ